MSRDMERLEEERPSAARKINRIKNLYLFIKEHGPVKPSQIEEEFGISKRTVERDLDALRYNELVHNPKRGYWQVTDRKVKGV